MRSGLKTDSELIRQERLDSCEQYLGFIESASRRDYLDYPGEEMMQISVMKLSFYILLLAVLFVFFA